MHAESASVPRSEGVAWKKKNKTKQKKNVQNYKFNGKK